MVDKNSKRKQMNHLKTIAHIHTDFPSKFGIPRQSGLVQELKGKVIFEAEYRNPDALRGLEEFSHLWLLWEFSETPRGQWSPTVRPPRLGGNKKMGVFATRSPFRPNPIGLSAVRMDKIELDTLNGPVIHVAGADLMDKTPIFDIKPYLPHADCQPEALGGFGDEVRDYALKVEIPEQWMLLIPGEKRHALMQVLAQDPRPAYQKDPDRIYGFTFAGYEVRFRVIDGVLSVCQIELINGFDINNINK